VNSFHQAIKDAELSLRRKPPARDDWVSGSANPVDGRDPPNRRFIVRDNGIGLDQSNFDFIQQQHRILASKIADRAGKGLGRFTC